jgi:hypothetical protein
MVEPDRPGCGLAQSLARSMARYITMMGDSHKPLARMFSKEFIYLFIFSKMKKQLPMSFNLDFI